MMRKALITGITGQDGIYLAELLLEKGYEVHGLLRGDSFDASSTRLEGIRHIADKIHLHHGDVTEYPTLWNLIAHTKPDEVYHLASLVKIEISLRDEFGAMRTNADSTHYLLSAIKALKPDCRFFFAGTAEQFGSPKVSPQNEDTPFNSITPYGISKTVGTQLVKMYREIHNVFACTAILFNHISPRTKIELLPRKITSIAAKIKLGLAKELRLGNLDARKDWGFAGDFVQAMWLMLQHGTPNDYVVGTGETHSVKELVEIVFDALDLDWGKYVVIDKNFFRPAEAYESRADCTKIKKELGWSPKTKFEDVIRMMVKADRELLEPRGEGTT